MKSLTGPIVLAVTLSALAGCQTTPIAATDVSCRAFQPLTYSSRDTESTVRGIRGHNAAWDATCK